MPRELIHIISSYAHSPQPRELCYDIRLYKQDMNIIDSFYHTQYTPGILLHDLMAFYGYIGYHNILTRHFMLSRHSVHDIMNMLVATWHQRTMSYENAIFYGDF